MQTLDNHTAVAPAPAQSSEQSSEQNMLTYTVTVRLDNGGRVKYVGTHATGADAVQAALDRLPKARSIRVFAK